MVFHKRFDRYRDSFQKSAISGCVAEKMEKTSCCAANKFSDGVHFYNDKFVNSCRRTCQRQCQGALPNAL